MKSNQKRQQQQNELRKDMDIHRIEAGKRV
jgi:hypothetical protein